MPFEPCSSVITTSERSPWYLSNSIFARVGTKSSIGVFLWATDSSIDAQVMGRGGNALNDLPKLISPNASTISENDIDSTK